MSSELQAVQFTFSDASTTSLQLGRSQRLSMSSGDRMGSLALGKTRFSVASAHLPRASLCAASKPTKGAAKVANEAPTKKKTLKEIVDYAGKRALSGGIPGMVCHGNAGFDSDVTEDHHQLPGRRSAHMTAPFSSYRSAILMPRRLFIAAPHDSPLLPSWSHETGRHFM
eukprot:gene30090-35052_t